MAIYRCDLGDDQYLGFDSENGLEAMTAEDVIVAMQEIIKRWGSGVRVMLRHDPNLSDLGYIRNCVSVFSTSSLKRGEGTPIAVMGDLHLIDDNEKSKPEEK